MDKNALLKSIGFSSEYIERLDKYSEQVIELSSTSIDDEIFSVKTQDLSSMKIREATNSFDTNYKFIFD